MKHKNLNHNLMLFLTLTFFLPFLMLWLQTMCSNAILKFILFGIEAASPTIAALLLIIKNHEWKAFFQTMFSRYYLMMALILPVLVAGLTMCIAKVISCFLLGSELVIGTLSIPQFIIVLWALVAEEFGWRGTLEPILIKKGISKKLVPMVVGVVWCLWHYHYFWSGRIDVPILIFLMSCIVESYLYRFFMDCTKDNLISAMMYHFSWNLFLHVFLLNPMDNQGSSLPYCILVIVEITSLCLLRQWYAKRKKVNDKTV